ncbi:MAG TPA: di-trans,poly-cis-decaprenylcistransferase [Candidatus Coproplasma excrementigallinarum]|uniref:Isoprenyl transferase n=1 Tax=Candidatus Coproplasma excrementigallinarum TaxID=2840747 RepID=A0A9D1MKA1_9FIRM|nr:di-trans,poly-cis-decaprenylcistransferase [Candidatus Coproplasma excrementigallinarum]
MPQLKPSVPVNVGIIMDGNGRWAKKRLLPRSAGHDAGMKRILKLVEHARAVGIKYLTLYVLSTENLSRPRAELEGLYSLFRKYFDEYAPRLVGENAAMRVIGDLSALPKDVAEKIEGVCNSSPKSAPFTLVFAVNYGGRAEIVRAANIAVARGQKVTEESFARLLYTCDMPDPDLIIRTGAELRLSNFLLWQAAYAELYFTDVLFPDFDNAHFDKALKEYSRRSRRFGKV